ncbi:hypothetical protein F443_20892 [Phytophthora nicotianae P1569]|uniref:Uncharacterized protein n=1 Tax=Phytophthora nicotianae P1569 TaxID=1317065 RepID=V9DZF8_PHYNI|nr:hypothetical protein F443_20892 [Phytophthora nicotianae P1569]
MTPCSREESGTDVTLTSSEERRAHWVMLARKKETGGDGSSARNRVGPEKEKSNPIWRLRWNDPKVTTPKMCVQLSLHRDTQIA